MYKVTATYNGTETVIHGKLDRNARIKDGKLAEFVNTTPTFSFTIYPNNPGYDMMKAMLTNIKVYDRKADENIFIGRVYSVSDIMTADGMIYKIISCEGELAYLCDTVQTDKSFEGSPYLLSDALSAILTTHNNKLEGDNSRKIQLGSVSGGFNDKYVAGYISTFDMVKAVCELAGCEFRVRNVNGTRYLDASSEFGSLSNTEIALSVNLKTLQRSVEVKDIVTRFYPLGAVIPGNSIGARLKINGTPYYITTEKSAELESEYGIVEAAKVYDDIEPTDWENTSAVNDAQNKLYLAGKKDYNKMIGLLTSFSIQAVDLSLINGDYDSLRIYNTYRVITKLQGIDDMVRLTGRTLMLDEPQNPTLTFGQKQTTLTGMLAGQ